MIESKGQETVLLDVPNPVEGGSMEYCAKRNNFVFAMKEV
jgi:hypothetical protein